MSKAAKSSQQKTSRAPSEKYSVREALVNYYIAVMFFVFPLFFTDAYFNIRHDKYGMFLVLSIVLAVALAAVTAYCMLVPESPDERLTARQGGLSLLRLTFPDIAMLAFLLVCIISTLLSEYKLDSLLGTAGRNSGLLLIAVYAAVYFALTRFLNLREYVFVVLAAGSAIVFLLAVLNCFYIDPLGMFDNLDSQTAIDFTSTIGNKNFLSSYICIVLPVLVSASVLTEKNSLRAVCLISSGLGFAALMTADSDSGILGAAAFAVIYLIWFSRRIKRLKRYFLSLSVMLAFAKLLRLFSLLMGDNSKGMERFQSLFVYSSVGWICLAVCAAIAAALYLLDKFKPGLTVHIAVPVTLGAIAAAAVLALLSIIVYFSVFDTTTDLGSLRRLLRFNDSWGTHRGFMWIRSFEILGNELSSGVSGFFKFIFGTGPDTFYYAFSPYFDELAHYGDTSTNAAHNEYINYLVTTGLAGLCSYAALVGGVIARAVKYGKRNPRIIICVSAVICYSVQAIVNISQPITTPLFIIMLALTEGLVRQSDVHGNKAVKNSDKT